MGVSTHVWTPEEDAYIIGNYSRHTLKSIAGQLGIERWQMLQHRCNRLIKDGRLDPRDKYYHRRWTDEDIDYLKESYGLVSDATICRKLRRSRWALYVIVKRRNILKKDNLLTLRSVARIFRVDDKVARHWVYIGALNARKGTFNIGKSRVWMVTLEDVEHFIKHHPELYECRDIDPEEHFFWRREAERWAFDAKNGGGPYKRPRKEYGAQEDSFIIDNYERMDYHELARRLGRPEGSVKRRIEKLRAAGLPVPYKQRSKRTYAGAWTPEQESYLLEHWGLLPDHEVAFVVGHSIAACEFRAGKRGVTKTSNRLKSSPLVGSTQARLWQRHGKEEAA
jgi:hypothetical protein